MADCENTMNKLVDAIIVSEMHPSPIMRNVIKCTYKMATGRHFVKIIEQKLCINLEWREIWLKVKFCEKIRWKGKSFVKKRKLRIIWNGEKCYQKSFSDIQNGRRPPFCEYILELTY